MRNQVISLGTFLSRDNHRDDSELEIGLSIIDVLTDIYQSERRFQLRDHRAAFLVKPSGNSALVAALFGLYPDRDPARPPAATSTLAGLHQRHRERDRHRPDGAAGTSSAGATPRLRCVGPPPASWRRKRPSAASRPTASLPVLDAALREAVRKAGAKSVIEDIEVAA